MQSALLILGVALGVAVVVAIDMASTSALAAFRLSTEAVAGRATHRVVSGPRGVDETLYSDIRARLGILGSAPVVQATVGVDALGGEAFTLLGVDPFAEPPFRSFMSGDEGVAVDALRAFLSQPDTVLLGQDTAAAMGLAPGDGFVIDLGARHRLWKNSNS